MRGPGIDTTGAVESLKRPFEDLEWFLVGCNVYATLTACMYVRTYVHMKMGNLPHMATRQIMHMTCFYGYHGNIQYL